MGLWAQSEVGVSPQDGSVRGDYTGFMLKATMFAATLTLLAGSAHAGATAAYRDARGMGTGEVPLAAGFDGASTRDAAACKDGRCAIDAATTGAMKKGGLAMAEAKAAPQGAAYAEVPAPELNEDAPGAKEKKSGGFFSNLFSGKGLLYGAGGALAGAGVGFLLGGPIGALIGGLVGAIGGLLLAKFLG